MRSLVYLSLVWILAGVALHSSPAVAQAVPDGKGSAILSTASKSLAGLSEIAASCEDGQAAGYPCLGVDLLSYMTIDQLGESDITPVRVNDIWGWTDPETGVEYALVGRNAGTSFVDISDPENPVLIGTLPRTVGARATIWRDIKTYHDHAFIVADGAGDHGLQVFDLTRLRGVSNPPVVFDMDALYTEFGSAHNIVINVESGFAYAVGSSAGGQRTCGGGLHMIDIHEPLNPVFAGCFADPSTGLRNSGYTHDAQCVTYQGPDTRYHGREICFGLNETALSIADVTDKDNPEAISVGRYPDFGYIHQGWLTADLRYMLVDDEGDERTFARATQTKVFDVSDLEEPVMVASYEHPTHSIDHNLYVNGLVGYQANYTSGLRVLDLRDPLNLEEIGYFDTTPSDSTVSYGGTWSVYPFFDSGNIVLSSIGEGLFVVRAKVATQVAAEAVPEETGVSEVWPNPFSANANVAVALVDPEVVSIVVYDVLGREVSRIYEGPLAGGRIHRFSWSPDDFPGGAYVIRIVGQSFKETRSVTYLK